MTAAFMKSKIYQRRSLIFVFLRSKEVMKNSKKMLDKNVKSVYNIRSALQALNACKALLIWNQTINVTLPLSDGKATFVFLKGELNNELRYMT